MRPAAYAWTLAALVSALTPARGLAQAPDLPSGLDGESTREQAPADANGAPALPAGLGTMADPGDEGGDETRAAGDTPEPVTGFWELRVGPRLQQDPNQDEDLVVGESRLQLSRTWYTPAATTTVTGDLLHDPVAEDHEVDLETGAGWLDLREANVLLRPLEFVDVRIGRQVLTWGVGDLVFLNDLFPKDFVSFFGGRDTEYLKAPSDAVRVSLFGEFANLDLVYTPRFDANRFITGERLSRFNPVSGEITGDQAVLSPDVPADWFEDDEIAARLYRNLGAYELAAYAYRGFWKNPRGVRASGELFFPALSVYGASVRGPVGGGIASAEIAWYDSRDDPDGTDPRIPNSEWRALLGFEREVAPEFTAGFQYYAEVTRDHDALRRSLPPGTDAPDRVRHTLTLRLTKLALNQRLTLSAFGFWSPSGDDGHLRLRAGYKATDEWLLEAGANAFDGPEDSFFGQFEDNSHVFLVLRRGF